MIKMRIADINELAALENFLVLHGANQWNYLPTDGVKEQFQRIFDGIDQCLVALSGEDLVGIAIYRQPGDLPTLFTGHAGLERAVYIAEVTVHEHWSGQGIGSSLLNDIAITAKACGVNELVIDRHEQNLASAGMMRKVGFVEVDCFLDLERRNTGNRKTTILSLSLN